MSYTTHLECTTCGTRYPEDRPRNNECEDRGLLEVRYDLDRLRAEWDRDKFGQGAASLWRYAPLLPVAQASNAVTMSEGWTPLVATPALGAAIGCTNLYYKDEGRNPSGTFKDRGASVAISRLRELGIETIIHNSSGNAAGSWALYAARAGIACVNVVPSDALPASLRQSQYAESRTLLLSDPWHMSGGIVGNAVDKFGWFNIGTLKEPYRLEGKKTIGYEICEQLGWRVPDAIVYPTGGGLGAIAIYKGIRELMELGWIEAQNLPRLIVVQYEGCAPIAKAFRDGKPNADVWHDLDVLPGGLKSTSPPGDRAVIQLLHETGGQAYTVSNEAALLAVQRIVRAEGLFPCPESAITLVGLEHALADGVVDSDACVVLVGTGSGLKSVDILPATGLEMIDAKAGISATKPH